MNYYDYGSPRPRQRRYTSTNRQARTRSRSRRDPPGVFFRQLGLSRKQEVVFILALTSLMAAWFLTPFSDVVSGFVLLSVPLESDLELGREALRALNKKYPSVVDRWDIERIGWDLVDSMTFSGPYAQGYDWSDLQKFRWSFGVVHANFANAFALPGGIVRVTDNLLKQLDLTEGEVAALIGHEMGHVLYRHSQRRMVKQQLGSTVMRAIIYEDNDAHDETFGEAVGEILLKGAAWLGEQRFSRSDEYQADGASWDILLESNIYNPMAMQSLLKKLWLLQGDSGSSKWESTHPGSKDRIEALETKWDNLRRKEQQKLKRLTG